MANIDRDKFIEKRSHVRLRIPLAIAYTTSDNTRVQNVIIKDISANGIRFENHDKIIKKADAVEMKMVLPDAKNPVHAKGSVIWKKRITLEDNAPFDIGIEFDEIEEDNKNTFIKFLCDYIYKLPEDKRYEKNKG